MVKEKIGVEAVKAKRLVIDLKSKKKRELPIQGMVNQIQYYINAGIV